MKKLQFTKMHGLGNDFMVFNCLEDPGVDFAKMAPLWSHRRFGVGFDQMLLIRPSQLADFRMEIINADGGEVEMCGNGIRCVAKYLVDHGLTEKKELRIETLAGEIRPHLIGEAVEVDMGEPILEGLEIPTTLSGRIVDRDLTIDGQKLAMTCVSMGNPHCVLFVEDVAQAPVATLGPQLENHELFPKRINVEFIQVLNSKYLKMRVWERGAGETMACGTGACASLVAAVLTGQSDREATVELKGGPLKIRWSEQDNHVYMMGPAQEVFTGEIEIP